ERAGKPPDKPVMTTSFRKVNCQYCTYSHVAGIKNCQVRDRERRHRNARRYELPRSTRKTIIIKTNDSTWELLHKWT
ncbi:hypothetical protein LSAT2_002957, partial [Lamellibrachia satsuma]